jgi:isopentenyldiphosphate isomerase
VEYWDLYTRDREKLNQTMVRGTAQPEGTCRLVVHICMFNAKGEMLIQQRQPFKQGWSNLWDFSVGGSAIAGDTSQTAAERELREELGIEVSFANIRPALTVHFDKGFDDIYLMEKELNLEELTLQPEEVQRVKWASREEIYQMIEIKRFIPYHQSLVDLLFFLRKHPGTHTRMDDTTPVHG